MPLHDANTGEPFKKTRRKLNSVDVSTMIYGKVPPQARDIEQVILGAIMLERGAIDTALEILVPESFYSDVNQRIYKACLALSAKGQSIDILTVSEQLRASGELDLVGGEYYVAGLTNSVVSSANIESHCRVVFQKYVQREIIRAGGFMVTESYEDGAEPFQLLDQVEALIFGITNKLSHSKALPIDALLVNAIREIEHTASEAAKGDNYLSGVPTGFKGINKLTHGWQKSDLIILAARPGVGKTALALALARHAAKDPLKPTPVGVFSLEMSAGQLIKRIISAESKVDLERINKGRIEDDDRKRIHEAIKRISRMPIHVDDTPSLNIFELRAKARRMKNNQNVGLIIVDYLQLMSGIGDSRSNREQEISTISRGLKGLAKELEVPIIALSQLSRETEKRTNKIPQLSDLRESGAIEQDADVVAFIYRPEYHGIHQGANGESNAGETHIKFAKHRNGICDTVLLRAHLYIQDFVDGDFIFAPGPTNGIDFKKLSGNDNPVMGGLTITSQLGADDYTDGDPF